jgi:photosystem II stability/assembly factor-like uncharacterized protein
VSPVLLRAGVAVLTAVMWLSSPAFAEQPIPARMAPLATRSLLLDAAEAGDHVIAVGDRGHILRSADGKTWTQLAAPVNSMLTAVTFVDGQQGWAVGHDAAILHTTDGGESWVLQHYDTEDGQPLMDVQFLDADHGLAIGAFGTLMRTEDGGAHWQTDDAGLLVEEGLHLYTLGRLGDGRWLVAGEQGLLAVSADGVTWQRIESPYEGSWYAFLPQGEHGVVLAGMRGNVWHSEDLNTGNWTQLQTGSDQGLNAIVERPQGGYVVAGLNDSLIAIDPPQPPQVMHREKPRGKLDIAGPLTAIVVIDGQPYVAGHDGVTAFAWSVGE